MPAHLHVVIKGDLQAVTDRADHRSDVLTRLARVISGSGSGAGDNGRIHAADAALYAREALNALLEHEPDIYPVAADQAGIRLWLEPYSRFDESPNQIAAMLWYDGRWRILDEIPVDPDALQPTDPAGHSPSH